MGRRASRKPRRRGSERRKKRKRRNSLWSSYTAPYFHHQSPSPEPQTPETKISSKKPYHQNTGSDGGDSKIESDGASPAIEASKSPPKKPYTTCSKKASKKP